MINLKDSIVVAKNMISKKNYQEAISLLEALWKQSSKDRTDYYVGSLLLQCYQKLAMWGPAIKLADHLTKQNGCWQSIKTNYAWIIYFAFFKNQGELDIEGLVIQIDTLCDLLEKEPSKLPLFLAIKAMITNNPQLNKNLIVQLLEKIDLRSLPNDIKPQEKQNSSLLSLDEQYILLYSKSLLEAEQYEKCIAFCKQTLQNSKSISDRNRIWLSRRLALCLHKIGEVQKAEDIYRIISVKKQEWYIFFEYAKIMKDLGDPKAALAKAAKAAVMKGEYEMKIHLWSFLYQELFSQGYFIEGTKCLALTAAIRKHKSWRFDQQLLKEMSLYNLTVQNLPHPKAIFEEIKNFLTSLSHASNPEIIGFVSRILPHGKAGFIKSGNFSYYFKTSDLCFPEQSLLVGLKLRFNLEKSYDPKKCVETQIAVNIRKDE
jgi:tetratricopeptide (TPR) repeat protein